MSPLGLCYHVAGGTSQVRRAVNARCGVTGGARGVAAGAGLLLSIEVDNVSRCNQYFMNGCMIPSLYNIYITKRECNTKRDVDECRDKLESWFRCGGGGIVRSFDVQVCTS